MNEPEKFRHYLEMPHRRPAYGVNSPAVFRHIVFRIDGSVEANPLRAQEYDQGRDARNRFIESLNAKLVALQKCCGATHILAFGPSTLPPLKSSVPKREKLSTVESSVATVDINRTLLTELHPKHDAGWRVRLLVDVHSEYYSLTFILDQPNVTPEDSSGGDAAQAREYEALLSKHDDLRKAPSSDIIKFFYDKVWQNIEPHLCGFEPEADRCIDASLDMPGVRLTEFRALALHDLNTCFAKHAAAKLPTRRIFLPDDSTIGAGNFQKSRLSLHNWVMRNDEFVHEMLKFNQLTQSIDRDANCVLCEVLDGGAIFGSSLGQIPSAPVYDDLRPALSQNLTPLRYFIIYNALSKYQLGRLVRRHHVLGELRIAALIDHDLIVRAGARIRALGNEVDALLARATHTEIEQAAKAAGDQTGTTDVTEQTTLSAEQLRHLQETLHAIHSDVEPGGLSYRVARSRYYAEIFERRVKELRIRRLEGFEPYDIFITRTLNGVFNFISTVGTRYSLLAERLSRLAITHEMERTAILTAEISDVQKKV